MPTRNKIYAIVEGHGEANRPAQSGQPAVVILINKLIQAMQPQRLFGIDPAHEILRRGAGSKAGCQRLAKKGIGYRPVRDQAAYTRKLDLNLARQRSRSFRRLYHAIEEIVTAETAGQPVVTPSSMF